MKKLIKKLLREGLLKENVIKTPLYHGTKYNFDKFDLKFFNAGSGDGGWLGRGVYLTNDYEYAESYGNVLECKVNINNPYIITDFIYSRSPEKLANDLGVENAREITSKLIKEGYDSVILTYPDKGYTKDGEYDKFIEICVFDPNNVEVINRIGEEVYIAVNENISGVDQILDKINQSGIDSLSDFEKKTLNDANSNDSMDIVVKNWLDNNYSDLQTINQTRDSFGKTKPFILFLDNDGELVMEYDVRNKTLYLPYQDITKYLGDHFDSKTFQGWFDKIYNIKPKKISNFFTNQKSL